MARIEPINSKDVMRVKLKNCWRVLKLNSERFPIFFKTIAISPIALDGFPQLQGALADVVLSKAFQEQITLCVSEISGCNYCLDAHTAIGKRVGFQKKKPFPAGKGYIPLPKLRQSWSLSGK